MPNWIIMPALLASAALLLGGDPAAAHHVMDGKLPQTLGQGLLSGLGHPLIGVDHLAFVIAAGIVSAFAAGGLRNAGVFIGASMAGVLVHVAKIGLPMTEPAVAITLVIAGLILASGSALGAVAWAVAMLVAGFLHGYAYGESIVGAETVALGGYLAGLALIQFAVAALAMVAARSLAVSGGPASPRIRGAGYVLSALGAAFLVNALI